MQMLTFHSARLFRSAALLIALSGLGTVPASATSIDYVIDFTPDPAFAALPSASFTWDGSVFWNFDVRWNGAFFDFTSAANLTLSRFGTGCNATQSPATVFSFLTGSICGAGSSNEWAGFSLPTLVTGPVTSFFFDQFAAVRTNNIGIEYDGYFIPTPATTACGTNSICRGTFSVREIGTTPTGTPEPASLLLFSLGLAALLITLFKNRHLAGRLK